MANRSDQWNSLSQKWFKRNQARKESERFKRFAYDDLIKRDKLNLNIFWLKDASQEDPDSLPPPAEIAAEIAESLEAALARFRAQMNPGTAWKQLRDSVHFIRRCLQLLPSFRRSERVGRCNGRIPKRCQLRAPRE